jgi:hypothetical protein
MSLTQDNACAAQGGIILGPVSLGQIFADLAASVVVAHTNDGYLRDAYR